jgi:hypothetical protein
MSTPSGELQVIRRFRFNFKDDNSSTSNASGPNSPLLTLGMQGTRETPCQWTSTTMYVVIIHFCLCILIHAPSALFLATKTVDNLTVTERAACTHPDAPPRLPPLPFTDHVDEMLRVAPWPIVRLPSDNAGVA